jgi:hypothetical protein
LFFLLSFSSHVLAQEDGSIDEIEGLFKEEAEEDDRIDRRSIKREKKASKKEEEPQEIQDLKKLETFSNIAVIQKRYLPKTGRFEFYFAGATNLNDAFFVGNGLNARFGYYFSEKWGIEAMYSFIPKRQS